MENKALGKGLSALIPEKSESKKVEGVVTLKTNQIQLNSQQPRTHYDKVKLEELKSSIQEKGILQPILVREKNGSYEVIAGERRLRAAKDLGMIEVPAIVKVVGDQEAFVIALIENIQREELNPIEEAEAFKKLIEQFQYTQETVAKSVGKDRSTITNTLRLLKLPNEMQKSVVEGTISMGHARALLSVESPTDMKLLFDAVIQKGLSVRELENLTKTGTKSSVRREKNKPAKQYEYVALEELLQTMLGTKVRIFPSKKRGKIVIEYYSTDDLTRVINLMKK